MSKDKGAIRVVQVQVNRAIQVIVCLMHMTESPFKHLLQHLDGGKIKWTSTKGELGTKIKNLNDNLVDLVEFTTVPTNVPDVESSIFKEACNRERLHQLCLAISNGKDHVDKKFIKYLYPVVSTIRWLTTAERVLGLYIREEEPSEAMKIMVKFTSQAYAPTHFEIFLSPGFENSSHHYLSYIKRCRVSLFSLRKFFIKQYS